VRRFFLFAVLWAALIGPGHVLAACPMGIPAGHEQGMHAPCHSDGDRDTSTPAKYGHDCCAWATASSASGKFSTLKSNDAFGELSPGAFAAAIPVAWIAPSLIRPPPLPVSRYALLPAAAGGDTFLRTSRLRL